MIMQEIGSGIYDNNGSVVINNPKNVEILSFLKEVLDSNICLEEAYWTPANYSAMADGTIATMPQGGWMGGFLKSLAPDASGKWGITYLPAWEAGGNRSSNNGGSFLSISSQCKDPDLAWKVIEFILLSKEGMLNNAKNYDVFSLFKPIWDDPSLLTPDPYYSDTILRKIYNEVADEIRPLNWGPNWPEATVIITKYSADFFNDKITAEDCLKRIEEELKDI
jgi:lactose/L-arabinose transport system substrate-binding protein